MPVELGDVAAVARAGGSAKPLRGQAQQLRRCIDAPAQWFTIVVWTLFGPNDAHGRPPNLNPGKMRWTPLFACGTSPAP